MNLQNDKSVTFLIPSMAGGGAEKVTLLLANELVSRGWKVSLLIAKLDGPYLSKLSKDITIEKLEKGNISKNLFGIVRYLKREKPPIFFSSMMYVNVIAALAAQIAGYKGKLVLSEHSHASTNMIANKNFAKTVILKLAKKVYPRADLILCVSEGVKNDLELLIPNLKKAVVQYNPIQNFPNEVATDRDRKFSMISMGRLDAGKNFEMMIRGFAEVINVVEDKDNFELVILGEGKERANLESLIMQLKLNDKVFLPGFIDKPAEFLANADLFLFTSHREGLPNVLIEALGYGLPIISTDCPSGPREILKDGEVGILVPVDDLNAFVNAILDEIRHPNMTSTKEQRLERAKDFSVEKIVDEYEVLFVDLLNT